MGTVTSYHILTVSTGQKGKAAWELLKHILDLDSEITDDVSEDGDHVEVRSNNDDCTNEPLGEKTAFSISLTKTLMSTNR